MVGNQYDERYYTRLADDCPAFFNRRLSIRKPGNTVPAVNAAMLTAFWVWREGTMGIESETGAVEDACARSLLEILPLMAIGYYR